jgi:hypothetical protein
MDHVAGHLLDLHTRVVIDGQVFDGRDRYHRGDQGGFRADTRPRAGSRDRADPVSHSSWMGEWLVQWLVVVQAGDGGSERRRN